VEAYASVLDLQTCCTQEVSASSAPLGALRQAQSLVTSSQPDGSANPIGNMQLKTQDGWLMTASSAVMLYSGEEEEADALIPMLVEAGAATRVLGMAVEGVWAQARASRRWRQKKYMVIVVLVSGAFIWERFSLTQVVVRSQSL